MTDLNEFLLKLSNDLGFNHIACWNIKNKEPLTTYPLEWTQHYTEHKLNELDHTLINHFKKPRPFIWGDSLMNRLIRLFIYLLDDIAIKQLYSLVMVRLIYFALFLNLLCDQYLSKFL